MSFSYSEFLPEGISVDSTNSSTLAASELKRKIAELNAKEQGLREQLKQFEKDKGRDEANREPAEKLSVGQTRSKTAMTAGRGHGGMQNEKQEALMEQDKAAAGGKAAMTKATAEKKTADDGASVGSKSRDVEKSREKSHRNLKSAALQDKDGDEEMAVGEEKAAETTPEIVYTAVQCDSCRRRGMRRDCVWQSGTSTSCIPCQKDGHHCNIGGMAIKSLKLHHPSQVRPGTNQAISVETELIPTPRENVDIFLERRTNIVDSIEDVLSYQGLTVEMLFRLMQRVRTTLPVDNIGEGLDIGDAESDEEEDEDEKEKENNTNATPEDMDRYE